MTPQHLTWPEAACVIALCWVMLVVSLAGIGLFGFFFWALFAGSPKEETDHGDPPEEDET